MGQQFNGGVDVRLLQNERGKDMPTDDFANAESLGLGPILCVVREGLSPVWSGCKA
ncbi:hypothetical protein GCM10009655_12800 [Rhodoglobus aureus]|uniref:Uncharacterized protein n=1 Tax=Rhodoglobus aureus TaxID=191497 RepID=A0ABP4G6J2_9MICO